MEGYFAVTRPFTPALLRGEIAADIVEFDGADPTTLIRTDQDFEIRLAWSLVGPLTPFVCGAWCVSVFVESIGPGLEIRLPLEHLEVPLDPAPGTNDYAVAVRIPAGLLPADACGTPYKLTVSVVYVTPKNQPGPMAGYVELPIIHFYNVAG